MPPAGVLCKGSNIQASCALFFVKVHNHAPCGSAVQRFKYSSLLRPLFLIVHIRASCGGAVLTPKGATSLGSQVYPFVALREPSVGVLRKHLKVRLRWVRRYEPSSGQNARPSRVLRNPLAQTLLLKVHIHAFCGGAVQTPKGATSLGS